MAGDPASRFKDVEIDGVIYRMPVDDAFSFGTGRDEPIDTKKKPLAIRAEMLTWTDSTISIRAANNMDEFDIAWPSLTKIAGVDPWPRVAIVWRYGGYRDDTLLTATSDGADALDVRIHALAAAARARSPRLVDPGWIDALDVEWEAVAALPNDAPQVHGDGAFRTSALARAPEPIVARRAPRTSTEAILAWLASGPERIWKLQPVEVVVTPEHLYNRAPAGVFRLPLVMLRAIVQSSNGDQLVIFGKRTQILLQRRADCPVLAELRKQLASRGAAP